MLLLLLLSCMALVGMEEPQTILRGRISLRHFDNPIYAGYYQQHFNEHVQDTSRALGISVSPATPLLSVYVSGEKVDNWTENVHSLFGEPQATSDGRIDKASSKNFPYYVPYSLIKGLKEGSTLKLNVWGKPVELVAQQIGFYADTLNFETRRRKQIHDFIKTPQCLCDKNQLIEDGVLALNQDGTYSHGAQGFKSEGLSQDDKTFGSKLKDQLLGVKSPASSSSHSEIKYTHAGWFSRLYDYKKTIGVTLTAVGIGYFAWHNKPLLHGWFK